MQELFLGTIPTQKGNVLHFAQCVGIFLQGSTTCMGRKPLQKVFNDQSSTYICSIPLPPKYSFLFNLEYVLEYTDTNQKIN